MLLNLISTGPLLGQLLGYVGLIGLAAPFGQSHKYLTALHKKYFDPFTTYIQIMFSTPRALRDIYTTKSFVKAPIYNALLDFGDEHNMLTTPSPSDHAYFRRLLGPAFNSTNLKCFTPLLVEVMQSVFKKIDAQLVSFQDGVIERAATLDVWAVCQAYAFDVIGEVAFGSSFRMIETGSHPFVTHLALSLKWMMMKLVLPESILPYLPGYTSLKNGNNYVVGFIDGIVRSRQQGFGRRVDLLQMLIDAKDTEDLGNGLLNEHISAHVRLFLTAGFETSANSMGFFMIKISQHIKYYERLLAELSSCTFGQDGLIDYDQLKELVWFDAILKESLRMNPVISAGMLRVAVEDCTVDELNVPKGTLVFASLGYIQAAHPGWGDPQSFRPERFLSATECGKSSEKAESDQLACDSLYMPFSIGTRGCVGKQFAIMEMKVFLGNFLRRYAIEEIQGQDLSTTMHVSVQLESATYNVKATKRSEFQREE